MKQIINGLLDAVDPDKQAARAREIFQTEKPDEKQMEKAGKELAKSACLPFDSPKFRNALIDIKKKNEQYIDELSKDVVLFDSIPGQLLQKCSYFGEGYPPLKLLS